MNKVDFSKTVLFFFAVMVSQVFWAKSPYNDGEKPAYKGDLIGEIAIYFPANQSRLIRDFSENANSLTLLGELMSDINLYSDIDSIVINGYASPEGSTLFNSRLSYERALAVKNYIAQNYPHVNPNKIIARSLLVDMQAIRDIIDNDLSLPFRKETKKIMSMQDISDVERLNLLNEVGGGSVIMHITKHYAASLRNATGIMFYHASDHGVEQIVVRDTVHIEKDARVDTLIVKSPADTVYIENAVYIDNIVRVKKPLFALKTNLLYNLTTAVNIEIEVPIGNRWSILGEYIFPWWLLEHNQYCLEIINANIEGRYWLGNRSNRPQLTGWFAGLYTGGGYYDVEWGNKGYQGEFYVSTGLTGGYAHTLGKKDNFRMEYSLGAGYFNTKYREYNPELRSSDDNWHLIRQQSGKYSWIGPTRLKVSLVWLLHHNSYTTKNTK